MPAPKRMTAPRRMNAAPKPTMFPHTVTAYNVEVHIDKDTMQSTVVNHITILHGVLLDASKAVNVRESGIEGADAVNLYIPFGVDAVDGVTGQTKRYAPPVEFWGMEDKAGAWTLTVSGPKTGDAGGNTFFVKGEVVEPDAKRQQIETDHDHVYSITKVDEKDFGGLRHWEVGGA